MEKVLDDCGVKVKYALSPQAKEKRERKLCCYIN